MQKLLQLGEEAVRALGELDAALYIREAGEEQLQIVSDAVLSHFRRLLEYLAMVAPSAGASDDGSDVEIEIGGPAIRNSGPIAPRIVAHREQSDDERWRALAAEMVTLQYGLGSELNEFERRFSDALANDRKEQAVRDLNDATTALMDGVFAVMTTVYECFLGYAEPERMVPGHRDTLGKALAVRQALAELRREVRGLNRQIQDRATPADVAETSYWRIVESLGHLIESDVFYYLRADSRQVFWEFHETLANGSVARNRNDCEGLDKYLDSLAFVSQRGVLMKHDADLKVKIADDLERALKFSTVLPEIACEVIEQAFVKAERLAGLDVHIDALVRRWSSQVPEKRTDLRRAVVLGRKLFDLVRPAPRPASSKDGDFF